MCPENKRNVASIDGGIIHIYWSIHPLFTHIIFSSFFFLVSISFVLLFNCFQLISQLKIFMIFPFKYFLSFVCFCYFLLLLLLMFNVAISVKSYIVLLWMFCDSCMRLMSYEFMIFSSNADLLYYFIFFFIFFQFSSFFWTKIRRIVDG